MSKIISTGETANISFIHVGDMLNASYVFSSPSVVCEAENSLELVPVSPEMAYRNNFDLIDWSQDK